MCPANKASIVNKAIAFQTSIGGLFRSLLYHRAYVYGFIDDIISHMDQSDGRLHVTITL